MGEYEDEARRIVGKVLGMPVVQNDHNVGHSIPDLYIDYPDRERAYVEVVADSAQKAWRSLDHELKKNEYGLKAVGLTYDWWVFPNVNAQVKKVLKPRLPELLRQLERAGETFEHWRDSTLKRRIQASPFYREIDRLGIDELVAGSVATGDATVHIAPPGVEGSAVVDLDRLVEWCAEFLASPDKEDVRRKLAGTNVSERHAFIVVGISSEWAVQHALSRDGHRMLPGTAPNLPNEITHLWLLGTDCSDRCIAWLPDRGGWIDFEVGPWHSKG